MLQITSLYGGPVEFLFVVDSTEDPAYHAVTRLLKDYMVSYYSFYLYDRLTIHALPF